MPAIPGDTQLSLPSVTVLKASAGSGKTYALTQRFVQFLLSRRVPHNDLRGILAITFSHNAARDMRDKVLQWLKKLSFGDPERLADMEAVIAGFDARAARGAGALVDRILDRYTDFQVQTIDSFMSTVFRASALDFGFSPEFEILLDPAPLLDYAFSLFLRDAPPGSTRARVIDEAVRDALSFKASADVYHWDPVAPLLAEIKGIDARSASLDAPLAPGDALAHLRAREARVLAALQRVEALTAASGLAYRGRSPFPDLLARARAGRFSDLIGRGLTLPVKKPPLRDPGARAGFEQVEAAWADVETAVSAYVGCWARSFHESALRVYAEMEATLEKVKRAQAAVFIGDIGRRLGDFLSRDIVPDIYFRIGERVWHFLIDEFQDTSPLQWRTLFPLLENSLASGGSLFAVGDTKQAIYGFRQADYRIMKSLEAENPFPSAEHLLLELDTNRRSRPRVLALAEAVFMRNAAAMPAYREAVRRSGLDSWTQRPLPGDDPGYAEVVVLPRDDEQPPEKDKLLAVMRELSGRGYGWGDIALLATKNEHIVRATSWLNEAGIPFISFSNLDVRGRRLAQEILALLSFLDSPPDDLSFATFILGELFCRTLAARGATDETERVREFLFHARGERPLYKSFQKAFPALWKECFAGLFRSAGYLPLYDLVSEISVRFAVFARAGEEEATLAKLLEAVKDFEGSGANSLRDFLSKAGGDESIWTIDVPGSAQSVRAMTVHKAKGLGFPVVVALLYGESSRGFSHTILEEDGARRMVKISRDIAAKDPTLQALYDQEVMKEKVNRLNGLYVTLTRALRETYVIGVKRDRDTYPFDIIPVDGFAPCADKGPIARASPRRETVATLSHAARPVAIAFQGGSLGREERLRGELVHRMLQLLGQAPDDIREALMAAGRRAARETRSDPATARELAAQLSAMIEGSELAGYFARRPGRTAFVEKEFCDATGRLVRMDRVVCDAEGVTVIDWKTGAENPGEHEAQIRDYVHVLAGVYPAVPIGALLAYVDRGIVRRVA